MKKIWLKARPDELRDLDCDLWKRGDLQLRTSYENEVMAPCQEK